MFEYIFSRKKSLKNTEKKRKRRRKGNWKKRRNQQISNPNWRVSWVSQDLGEARESSDHLKQPCSRSVFVIN